MKSKLLPNFKTYLYLAMKTCSFAAPLLAV